MGKHTKKVGITGKYGTRYGASVRKQIKKMEVSQHARFTCVFCGKVRAVPPGILPAASLAPPLSGSRPLRPPSPPPAPRPPLVGARPCQHDRRTKAAPRSCGRTTGCAASDPARSVAQDAVQRVCTGIWKCGACRKTMAGALSQRFPHPQRPAWTGRSTSQTPSATQLANGLTRGCPCVFSPQAALTLSTLVVRPLCGVPSAACGRPSTCKRVAAAVCGGARLGAALTGLQRGELAAAPGPD
jgi:large subunit ribosomal protein L37Ae